MTFMNWVDYHFKRSVQVPLEGAIKTALRQISLPAHARLPGHSGTGRRWRGLIRPAVV